MSTRLGASADALTSQRPGRVRGSGAHSASQWALIVACSAVVLGLGAVLHPQVTFALVVTALLVGMYWHHPLLVPIFIVAAELVIHPVGRVAGFNVFLSDLVWLPAVPIVLLSRAASKRLRAFRPFRVPMALLIITAVLSSVLAHAAPRALVGTFQLLELFAIAWVTASLVHTPQQIVRVVVACILAVAVDASLAIGQLLDLVPIPQLPLAPGSDSGRVTGVSGNALGAFLGLGFALSLGMSLSFSRRRTWTFTVMNLVMVLALVATGIRSAWVSAAVALIVGATLTIWYARKLATSRLVGILGTAAALAGVGVLFADKIALRTVYLSRLTSVTTFAEPETGSTTYARLQFWDTSLRMISDNLWLGVGPKNWVERKSEYGLPEYVVGLSTREISDPHHVLLEVASEQGILAALATLALYFLCAQRCLHGLRSGSWAPAVAVPLAFASLARPLSQILGGDLGSDRTWYVLLGLTASASYYYLRESGGSTDDQLQLGSDAAHVGHVPDSPR